MKLSDDKRFRESHPRGHLSGGLEGASELDGTHSHPKLTGERISLDWKDGELPHLPRWILGSVSDAKRILKNAVRAVGPPPTSLDTKLPYRRKYSARESTWVRSDIARLAAEKSRGEQSALQSEAPRQLPRFSPTMPKLSWQAVIAANMVFMWSLTTL